MWARLAQPDGVAIDAGGTVWTANGGAATVSAFSSAGTALSPSGGFAAAGARAPAALAVNPKQ